MWQITAGVVMAMLLFAYLIIKKWNVQYRKTKLLETDIVKLEFAKSAESAKLNGEIIRLKLAQTEETKKLNDEIWLLKRDLVKAKQIHLDEMKKLDQRLADMSQYNANLIGPEMGDIIVNAVWREISELNYIDQLTSIMGGTDLKRAMVDRFNRAVDCEYKYRFIVYLHPELDGLFVCKKTNTGYSYQIQDHERALRSLFGTVDTLIKGGDMTRQMIVLKSRADFLESSKSNISAIPYMSGIMADYETYGLENLAKELDWGYSYKRAEKVKSIREIRRDAQAMVERNKDAQYQLAYLLSMFPGLEDVIESDYNQLPIIQVAELSDHDGVRDYLSIDEYRSLSDCVKNQLALDRYKASRKKTKWQIGRDYELYVGYKYFQSGFAVDYFGSYMGLEDLGRDLIVKRGETVTIVQCKYWSSSKEIHEKHITQLYGTVIGYCIENDIKPDDVNGRIVTNIALSQTAKKMAKYLNIECSEHVEMGEYPCVKCNVGHDEYGDTKIYHLPFDQQYDSTKIKNPGEFFAMTVEEAEKAGFRRAHKWLGDK